MLNIAVMPVSFIFHCMSVFEHFNEKKNTYLFYSKSIIFQIDEIVLDQPTTNTNIKNHSLKANYSKWELPIQTSAPTAPQVALTCFHATEQPMILVMKTPSAIFVY